VTAKDRLDCRRWAPTAGPSTAAGPGRWAGLARLLHPVHHPALRRVRRPAVGPRAGGRGPRRVGTASYASVTREPGPLLDSAAVTTSLDRL